MVPLMAATLRSADSNMRTLLGGWGWGVGCFVCVCVGGADSNMRTLVCVGVLGRWVLGGRVGVGERCMRGWAYAWIDENGCPTNHGQQHGQQHGRHRWSTTMVNTYLNPRLAAAKDVRPYPAPISTYHPLYPTCAAASSSNATTICVLTRC